MEITRTRQLQQALAAIQRRWGSDAVRPLSALRDGLVCIPTGYPALDEPLRGGVPCGQVAELSGAPTSGATTLALRIVAEAQAQHRLAVLVDLSQTFDARYAAACGSQGAPRSSSARAGPPRRWPDAPGCGC